MDERVSQRAAIHQYVISFQEQTWRRTNATTELEFLVTNPEYQRRGAGAKLLAWGTEQADKLGARMALESTPAGLALYKRFGFREVDSVIGPNDPASGARVWMIRDPPSDSTPQG